MKILLVDDEKHILQVIGDFLGDCGYGIAFAGDGAAALKVLEEIEDIDLIVSDIRMPKMDGIALLKAVRVRFPGIPVILMTGHGDEQVAIDALHEGAQDYLKKPIRVNDFLACIEQVEERSRLEAQIFSDYQSLLHSQRDKGAGEFTAQREEHEASKASFLVVDGDRDIREGMREILEGAGHQVQFAVSGEEALKLFAEKMFDVVVSEVDLPGLDGIEMIQHMRAADPAVTPVILTTREDRLTLVRALEGGARGLLVKPFTNEELELRIAKALGERKRMVDARLLLGDLMQVRGDLQQKVVERERYLSQLIDAAPFGVVSTDRDGQILTFNGQAEKMYGYQQNEIVGSPLSALFNGGPLDKEKTLDEEISSVAKVQHRRKNEEPIPVLVRRRNIHNDKNQSIARLYIMEDLTEREQMESQLLYAERLSLLGQLAPRIAHEFKTPLQLISGNVEMAQWELENGSAGEALKNMESVMDASEQMDGLVQQMLNLGKPTVHKKEEIDLVVELDRILGTLGALGVIKYCQITKDFAVDLPKIYADPGQIGQVFRNLIVNAAQAMEKAEEREMKLGLQVSPHGGEIEATVSDTGSGIPEEDLERIFQPFYTTKAAGKGTGLGLPIVKTILDRCGASVAVESQVGKGTEFKLSFPVPRY